MTGLETLTKKLKESLNYWNWILLDQEHNYWTDWHTYKRNSRLKDILLFTLFASEMFYLLFSLAYISMMISYPSVPGTPFFDVQNITHFLDVYGQLYTDYGQSESEKII